MNKESIKSIERIVQKREEHKIEQQKIYIKYRSKYCAARIRHHKDLIIAYKEKRFCVALNFAIRRKTILT
jgi:hypothetical protein